ncbi:MAG TPA: universal stress protein [Terriglobales bacterium]|jgi:nucleotide-binding universal stress UspA family protein|nr:universal stress protein [Terriglobales bacterium]
MAGIKTIVAPTDLSDLSVLGVNYALRLAEQLGAQVILLNTIRVEELTSLMREMKNIPSPQWDKGLEDRLIESHERLLDEFAKQKLFEPGAGTRIRRVVHLGEPYKMILNCAREEKADLIVMSTHGRSGLPRLMLGSVTEKVLRSSSCPVLAIPPHES